MTAHSFCFLNAGSRKLRVLCTGEGKKAHRHKMGQKHRSTDGKRGKDLQSNSQDISLFGTSVVMPITRVILAGDSGN